MIIQTCSHDDVPYQFHSQQHDRCTHPPHAIPCLCSSFQQCLNMLQGETKPIRKLVEVRFDEIKTITESKNPILDMELSDW